MRPKVVIIGAGISGLTAAHELIERGFEVHVYERKARVGGKAASGRIKEDHGPGLPTEHGYRFFPGWYRHLPDTLGRIPFRGKQKKDSNSTVLDNLITLDRNTFSWNNRPPLDVPLHLPSKLADLGTLTNFAGSIQGLGLTSDEVALFVRKLSGFAMMTDEQRRRDLESVTWWDYLECDETKTAAYQGLVQASTRTSIAAKATEVSAYTIGRLALRSLGDTLSAVDRILNGPTSETWLAPWRAHLESSGVKFHDGFELDAIEFDGDRPEIARVRFGQARAGVGRRLGRLVAGLRTTGETLERLQRLPAGPADADLDSRQKVLQDHYDELLRRMNEIIDQVQSVGVKTGDYAQLKQSASLVRRDAGAAPAKGKAARAGLPNWHAIHECLDILRAKVTDHLPPAADRVEVSAGSSSGPGCHFVFALPLEQLAYYVARSPMATALDPSLRNVVKLSRSLDWMAGIQFYLKTQTRLPQGHIVGVDTPWALTAIEQSQHWKDVALPEDVNSVISVDISMWKVPGQFVKKEAFDCTNDEIAHEVWSQLKRLVNRRCGMDVLRDDMLRRSVTLVQGSNYALDESILDLLDRKKQAFLEHGRVLSFSASELTDGTDFAQSYMWGPRPRFNAEPLLINRPGTAALRPAVTTNIRNMFIAGDYVRSETDLACMEGANESGRRAANAVLDAVGFVGTRSRLWTLSVPRDAWAKVAGSQTVGWAVAAGSAARGALTGVRDRFLVSMGRSIAAHRAKYPD